MPRKARKPKGDETTQAAGAGQGTRLSEGGQSGDLQGIPDIQDASSESVRELLAEGQSVEASIIDAVENAPNADEGEIKTKEVSEDDVPPEYQNPDLS